jgi:hypothetical protein
MQAQHSVLSSVVLQQASMNLTQLQTEIGRAHSCNTMLRLIVRAGHSHAPANVTRKT